MAEFRYDVFLSHSTKDNAVARALASRLRADGLSVLLQGTESRPEEPTDGLEQSRVLVLCMSANAFGSEWTQLEAGTFRFRDPQNRERRFLPLRLDDAPIRGSLAPLAYINWLPEAREEEYDKLLEACRLPTRGREKQPRSEPPVIDLHCGEIVDYAFSADRKRMLSGGADRTVRLWDLETGECVQTFKGHADQVWSVEWCPDERRVLSAGQDRIPRLWDVATGSCLRKFEGHTNAVRRVVCGRDPRRALSSAFDSTLRLWDLETGRCLRVLAGHTDSVVAVEWSSDRLWALSGSADKTLRLWDLETGQCLGVFEGHTTGVMSIAWSVDKARFLSGSFDGTLRLWDLESRRCLRVFEGHTDYLESVAWTTDQLYAISSSSDQTVRVWDIEGGRCLRVLEGHTAPVQRVAWSADQRRAFSGDLSGQVRSWDLAAPAEVQYTNAKVLLVGESGAGKTGLSKRLTGDAWEASDSTVGAWATQWKLPVTSDDGIEREIWLWDFGGQADQRLIHQLYMGETAMVVLVFDGQRENLLETLSQWDRDLTRAADQSFVKLLVAARVDAGGLRISKAHIETFARERGYIGVMETSAKTGQGCQELRQAIIDDIAWENIPWRSSPLLFKRLKDEIIRLKDSGRVLMRFNELRETLQLRLAGDGARFVDEELKSVINLLAGPGVVWELKFGSWVLLQPEYINAYAQAVIRTMREDEYERGCIPEERVLNGQLTYATMVRLKAEEERFVLLAMHQMLVERGLCLRERTELGNLLVFPSYYRQERPKQVEHPAALMSYRFNGFLEDIYASLVVRLHHTRPFLRDQLWYYAADFRTIEEKQLGIKLTRLGPGTGELEVYFDQAIDMVEKILFSKYIHEHLLQNAKEVVRLRHYACPHCGTPVGNRDVAMKRLADGKTDLVCISCEKRIPLWDALEERFGSPEIQERVRELMDESKTVLDNESRERALVGEVISTVALAGQISREYPVRDHGIDMEIELTNDASEPSGKKLFLVLRTGGNSDVVPSDDGNTHYWLVQPFPVMLVMRAPDGETRWIEMRDWLKQTGEEGWKGSEKIPLPGERFDVMSLRRRRDALLQDPRESLFKRIIHDSDENLRIEAMKRLTELLPDEETRDFLLRVVWDDPSANVRVAAADSLAARWWKELAVRRSVRRRASDEQGETRDRFGCILKAARSQLSGLWEAKLAGERVEETLPQSAPGYPAFRVSRFRLRSIGPFHDTGVIELRPDLNIFLGDNAAGKTTILRCLALASIGLAPANEVEEGAASYLRKEASRGTIEVLLDLVPDFAALPEEYGSVAVGLQIAADSSRFAAIPDHEMTLKSANGNTNGAEQLGILRSKSAWPFGFVSAYGAVRTFNSNASALQGSRKKLENEWARSLFDPEAPLVNPAVLSKFIRGDTSNIEGAPPGLLPKRVTDRMRASFQHMFPEVKSFLSEGEDDLQLNGTGLRFGELSDGYRSLLALTGHMLRNAMKLVGWTKDPTQVEGILLVDEMDLHLHPIWQSHVVNDFRIAFPNVQLIATTHSPLVVASLKREHVLVMCREDDGRIAVERPQLDPRGLGVAGILTSIFELSSTIDQPTLDKITRRLELHSQREEWTEKDQQEYSELTNELARLGFSRELSDPYFERFAVAMAKRHKAVLARLTTSERLEVDSYADRLLAKIMGEASI